jgi:branched-chain amino acid transport system ATP-binding protein
MLETRKRKPDVMIEVKSVYKQFGGVHAVDNATLKIDKGSITGLIGPNGAGKTTLFNIIAGNLQPSSGQILLDGEDVTGLPPHLLFKKGLLRTFQLAHEFSTLTVLENLMMVPDHQLGESLMSAWFSHGEVKRQEAEIRERAMEVIGFLNMTHVAQELAGNLSGGQKKLIELGRTMMVDAKVVLLDEVGAGVNRTLLSEIGDAIVRLNKERGYTFCMIEHDMDFIGKLCDPVIVMAEGTVLAEGTAEEVRSNEAVIEAYLGRGLKNKTPEQMRAMADANGGRRLMYLIGENMTGGYGGADILKNCTVGVDKGEIAVIVGPNGAGKSTAMKAMLGMLKLRLGRVVLDGKEITGLTPQARVAEGIAFVPQTSNVSPA